MRTFILSLCLLFSSQAISQKFITHFEQSGGKASPEYADIIRWWKGLAAAYPTVQLREMGPTDAGYPLHLVLVSTSRTFNIKAIKSQKKTIIFINNGIHPGEPDGIDASMLLARDIVQNRYKLPADIVLAFIPVYNIGGALNRSTNYRIDQNGPEEKGFRGNAQNLDLNRDFIKMDSKNAASFARIFQLLDPDIFIDNHVSNGADYQHVMTLLVSQHNKLGGPMGEFMNKTFEPGLYPLMKKKGFDLVPYVNHFGETPDQGWPEFFDSPRYGSGYGTLWNTFAFVPETHMLKPYQQRVAATKAIMESFIEFADLHGNEIIRLRDETARRQQQQSSFPIAWKWDRTKASEILFKGYDAGRKKSEVSGLERLYYDRNQPFEKKISFYNTYEDTLRIEKPLAYIIPKGWWKVIERLQANNIRMQQLKADTVMEVEAYSITDYTSTARPYEGHHPNSRVQVWKKLKPVQFRKGDYLIPLAQKGIRFLVETLEPQAPDSYFAWNFFDPILGQKEGFSDYVFEETAAAYLRRNEDLQRKLAERKRADTTFANSGAAQLNFVYQNSPYFEGAFQSYPVYRLIR